MQNPATTFFFLLLVLVLAAHGPAQAPESVPDALVRGILQIVGEHRVIEPRLVGAGRYEPCGPVADIGEAGLIPTPFCGPMERILEPLSRLGMKLRSDLGERPTPRKLHGRGLVELLTATDAEDLDLAIQTFEAGLNLAADDPHLLGDLSAAHLVRAQRYQRTEDLLHALAAADQALRFEPGLAAARFNRALALEYLHLRRPAAEAWRSYQQLDPGSWWSAEAARRRYLLTAAGAGQTWNEVESALRAAVEGGDESLARSLIESHLPGLRSFAERTLLGEWAMSHLSDGDSEASVALHLARLVGKVVKELYGDSTLAESVEAIDRALREGGSRLQQLSAGHADFARVDADRTGCRALLARVEDQLRRARTPALRWVRIEQAICAYGHRDFEEALEILGSFDNRSEDNRSLVAGRAQWIAALIHFVHGDLTGALAGFRTAREIFRAAGEADDAAYLEGQIAKTLLLLGAGEEAWRHRLIALEAIDRIAARGRPPRHAQRIFNVLEGGGEACEAAGLAELALYFRDLQVELSRRFGSPPVVAESLLRRARLYRSLGHVRPALNDLSEAREMFAATPSDDLILGRIEADLNVTRARVADLPAEKIAALDRAASFFAGVGSARQEEVEVLRLMRARAAVKLQLRDDRGAEQDLENGIALVEKQRRRLDDPQLAASFLAQARSLYDDLARHLIVRGGSPERAFDVAERASNRILLDRASRSHVEPMTIGLLRKELPSETVVLAYRVFEEFVSLWIVRKDGLGFVDRAFDRETVRAAVAEHRSSLLRQRVPEDHDMALPELLFPGEVELRPGERIVVIPDRELDRVSFAAIENPATGRFVVEDHPVTVAPSATLFVRNREVYRQRRSAEGGLLAVLDPAFDRDLWSALPDLPAAASGAERLARHYSSFEVLSGERATPAGFLAAAAGRATVQFSGHSIVSPGGLGDSGLLLAPETGKMMDSGLLRPEDIDSESFSRTRLIILASCRTALGEEPGEQGLSSLAASFLAAGVPAVIGSLWDLEDAATAQLVERLHAHLAEEANPADALRAAQLAMLRHEDPRFSRPVAWAGVEILGGV